MFERQKEMRTTKRRTLIDSSTKTHCHSAPLWIHKFIDIICGIFWALFCCPENYCGVEVRPKKGWAK